MRIAFMGTPDFAATCLGELIASDANIAVVYTKTPQPAGRGKKVRQSPVHSLSVAHSLLVLTPTTLKTEEAATELKRFDIDVAIVVAYGLILPKQILDIPRLGCFNLHASLLPRWRGAAPIQRAIMAGDQETGVQVMRMEEGLDTGPVLLSEKTQIDPSDTFQTLHDRLALTGAQLLPRFLAALERGQINETPQSEDGITYAEKISSAEARIDWSQSALSIDQKVRGLSPFPGAWFEIGQNGEIVRIKALSTAIVQNSGDENSKPGTVLSTDGKLIIKTIDGALQFNRLQRAGRAAQSADEFLRGFPLRPGAMVS
ncbi:MAG: methionyl-tRNA formyltransferase [Pseudomonadota bacterium]